jgi:GH24 family phage-related lysozyme (muramidase)/GNAT superfamily N-acetyltransferase
MATYAPTLTSEFSEYITKLEGDGSRRFDIKSKSWVSNVDPKTGNYLPYQDTAGKWTIGTGILINEGKSAAGYEGGRPREELRARGDELLAAARDTAKAAVASEGREWETLTQQERQWRTEFSYNLSPEARAKYVKMDAHLRNGDFAAALGESDRKYRMPPKADGTPGDWVALTPRNVAHQERYSGFAAQQSASASLVPDTSDQYVPFETAGFIPDDNSSQAYDLVANRDERLDEENLIANAEADYDEKFLLDAKLKQSTEAAQAPTFTPPTGSPETPQAPAAPSTPEAPTDPAQGIVEPQAPTEAPGAPVVDPARAGQAEGDDFGQVLKAPDDGWRNYIGITKSAWRGVAVEAGDMVDNTLELLDMTDQLATIDRLGLQTASGLEGAKHIARFVTDSVKYLSQEDTIRGAVENVLGEADTPGEEIIESITGPIFMAVVGSKAVALRGFMSHLLSKVAVPSLTYAAGVEKGQGNIGNLIEDSFSESSLADTNFIRAISIDEDDNAAERFAKNTAEGLLVSFVADAGIAKVIQYGKPAVARTKDLLGSLRGYFQTERDVVAAVARTPGATGDPVIAEAANNVAVSRKQLQLVETALEDAETQAAARAPLKAAEEARAARLSAREAEDAAHRTDLDDVATPAEQADFGATAGTRPKHTVEDALGDLGDVSEEVGEAAERLSREADLGITRDREVSAVVRDKGGTIIGTQWRAFDNGSGNYEFDVAVDAAHRGTGVGSDLIDDGIAGFDEILEHTPDATMRLSVTSDISEAALARRGFEVVETRGGIKIMAHPAGKPPAAPAAPKGPRVRAKFDEQTGTWDDAAREPVSPDSVNSQHLADNTDLVPTKEQQLDKMKKNQIQHVGKAAENIPEGTADVGLRIDIDLFENHGLYSVAVHGPKGGTGVGKILGHEPTATLTGPVRFSVGSGATKILKEGKRKSPVATVKGAFSHSTEMPADIDELVPVGFNPHKADFFYNKITGEEVLEGDGAFSIGNTVYTRVTKTGTRKLEGVATAADDVATDGRAAFANSVEAKTLKQLRSETSAAAKQLEAHEATLRAAALETTSDGRTIEAQRRALKDAGRNDTATDRALGEAADRNMPPAPGEPVVLARTPEGEAALVLDSEASLALRAALESGDVDQYIDALTAIFRQENRHTLSTDEGIKLLLKTMQKQMGNAAEKFGIHGQLSESIPLHTTAESADKYAADIVARHGGDPKRVARALDDLLPGEELAEQINTVEATKRLFSRQVENIINDLNVQGIDIEDMPPETVLHINELIETIGYLDKRVNGVLSETGRGLGAARLPRHSAGAHDDILKAGKEVQESIDEGVEELGEEGTKRLKEVIEAVRDSTTPEQALANLKDYAYNRHTLGDMMFTLFLNNTLSGPATQVLNFATTGIKALITNPLQVVAESAALAVRNLDTSEMRAVTKHWKGLRHGLKLAVVGGAGVAPTVKTSFRQGHRVTATGGKTVVSAMAEDHAPGLLTSEAVGSLVGRGVPFATPFRGFSKKKGATRQLLGVIPRKNRKQFEAYMRNRNMKGVQAWNFIGRVLDSPTRLLAATDELWASANYNANLMATVDEHVRGLGLLGREADEMTEQLYRDTTKRFELRELADPNDTAQIKYLKALDGFNKGARDYTDKAVFTEHGRLFSDRLLQLRKTAPASRWFAPFVRTPLNLAVGGIRDFTPAGALSEVAQHVAKGTTDSRDFTKAMGKMALTAGYATVAMDAITKGNFTSGGSTNWDKRKQQIAAGFVPYSVPDGFGGRVALDRADPMVGPFMLMADVYTIVQENEGKEAQQLAFEVFDAISTLLESKTAIEGLGTISRVLENPGQFITQEAVSIVERTAIPGFSLARSWDRALYKDATMINKSSVDVTGKEGGFWADAYVHLGSSVKAQLPPAYYNILAPLFERTLAMRKSMDEVAKLDQWGDQSVNSTSWGPDILTSNFKSGTENPDAVDVELAKFGWPAYNVNRNFGEINGIPLTPKQQHKFQKIMAHPKGGASLKTRIRNIIFQPGSTETKASWDNMTDNTPMGDKGMKHRRIAREFEIQRRRAVAQFLELEENSGLANRIQLETRKGNMALTTEGRDALIEYNESKGLAADLDKALGR